MKPQTPKKRRKAGAWRGWGADIPTENFLAPMDDEDLDWAESKLNDEWCVTLPEYVKGPLKKRP